MKNCLNLKALHAVLVMAVCMFSHDVPAAPTLEQLKKVIESDGIPQWQRSVAQARRIHANPPDADTAEIWKALDAEINPATGKAPLARATTPRDGKDAEIMTAWLRWRVLSENADGRYSYAYAANLHRMRDSEGKPLYPREAAVFLIHARIALAIDGARCADRASPQGIILRYETQNYLLPLVEQVDKLPKKERVVAVLEAVSLEEVRGERPPLMPLCTSGARSAGQALAKGRALVEKPQDDSNPSLVSKKTYEIDGSGVEASLIPEEAWKLKRREILDQTIQRVAEML